MHRPDNPSRAREGQSRPRFPNEFYDEGYPLSPVLTRSKQSVVVRFQPQSGNTAGGIYGARLVRK